MAISFMDKAPKLFNDRAYEEMTKLSQSPQFKNALAAEILIHLGLKFKSALQVVLDNRVENTFGEKEIQEVVDFSLMDFYPIEESMSPIVQSVITAYRERLLALGSEVTTDKK